MKQERRNGLATDLMEVRKNALALLEDLSEQTKTKYNLPDEGALANYLDTKLLILTVFCENVRLITLEEGKKYRNVMPRG